MKISELAEENATLPGMRLLLCAALMLLCGCNSSPSPVVTPTGPAATPAAAATPPPRPEDRWDVSVKTDELDGTRHATLRSNGFFVRCGGKLDGYIVPNLSEDRDMLRTDAEDHSQSVRFRLDGGPLRRERWGVSDDFRALFLPTRTLRQTIVAKKLLLEFEPEYLQPQTETVDLSGLKEAYAKAGCK